MKPNSIYSILCQPSLVIFTEMKILPFLFEDIASDLVKKYPNKKEEIIKAKELLGTKLVSRYLPWIAKVLQGTDELVEDIVPLVKTFEKKIGTIKAKLGPKAVDIFSYKAVNELAEMLEGLPGEAVSVTAQRSSFGSDREWIEANSDVLYSKPEDPWILVMPKNTEESCIAGSGTTWCTARRNSQNLFLNYVARREDVILFYTINTEADVNKNPTAKMAVGFAGGKPVLDGKRGGLSVDAKNDGITREDYEKALGSEKAHLFLKLMSTKASSVGTEHPAKLEYLKLAKYPLKLEEKIKSYHADDALADFLQNFYSVVENKGIVRSVDNQMVFNLVSSKKEMTESETYLIRLFLQPRFDLVLSREFYEKAFLYHKEVWEIRDSLFQNQHVPLDIWLGVLNELEAAPNANNLSPVTIERIMKFGNPWFKLSIAGNSNLTTEQLVEIANLPGQTDDSIRNLARNQHTTIEVLRTLLNSVPINVPSVKSLKDNFWGIDFRYAEELFNTLAEKISKMRGSEMRLRSYEILFSSNRKSNSSADYLSQDVFITMSQDGRPEIRNLAGRHSPYAELAKAFAKSNDLALLRGLAINPVLERVPEEADMLFAKNDPYINQALKANGFIDHTDAY